MKIFRNIPYAYKFYAYLRQLHPSKKIIEESRLSGDLERERAEILKCTSQWGDQVCNMLKIEIDVQGKENIPTEGPVLYVSNHQGYADIFVCCKLLDKIQFGYIIKKEVGKIPFFGAWMKRIRSVMIDRGNPRAALLTINTGIEYLKEGFSLLVFPEGTRSQSSKLGNFKAGSLRLATKSGAPIVPISLNGTYNVYETTGLLGPAKVTAVIHPPIETKGMDRKRLAGLSYEIREIIRTAPNLIDADPANRIPTGEQ